jgi:flagellar motor switch/type III secretory pathway protein FliN
MVFDLDSRRLPGLRPENRILSSFSVAAMLRQVSGRRCTRASEAQHFLPFFQSLSRFWSPFCFFSQHMAPPIHCRRPGKRCRSDARGTGGGLNRPNRRWCRRLTRRSRASRHRAERAVARLPVELDVAVPVREFRVRNLLALEPGQVIETQWAHGEDCRWLGRCATGLERV